MRAYVSRLHPVLLVALVLFTIGFGLAGWRLRPAANGFPTVSGDMQLFVGTAGGDNFTETLTHTSGSGAVLTLYGMSPDTNLAAVELVSPFRSRSERGAGPATVGSS